MARRHLREQGLQANQVGLIPAAAGGPKGLLLNGLDRHLFGHWLQGSQELHLVGASIGAWRMATACLPGDADANFRAMAEAYVSQRYDERMPGQRRMPAREVSARFERTLAQQFAGREAQLLNHPRHRLHIVTSHGRTRLLLQEGRWRTPLGYLGAYAANALRRRWLGRFLERVVFSDSRTALPLALHDFPSRSVRLDAENVRPALLASCSIPFWLAAQDHLPGAPRGAYWDGGITDYHLHLDYRPLQQTTAPLVLYPHFQSSVLPGWFDKALRHRHRPTAFLDNLVLLTPTPAWIARLPGAKLPDRNDFLQLETAERQRRWRIAVAESERLVDAFVTLTRSASIEAQPL
jgi:hypothetical protein